MLSIGAASYSISADASGVSQGLNEAKKEITGFHSRMGRMFASLPGMAKVGIAGGIAGIGAMLTTGAVAGAHMWWDRMTDGIEAYQEKAIATVKASKILGDSIGGFSKVAYAVGGVDQAKEAIQELGETMGAAIAGEQGAIDLFKGLGTSAEELADLPVDERLIKIADAMKDLTNFEKLDVGKKLFKRYADDILPLIADGPDKIRDKMARGMDLGLVVDAQSAKAAFAYKRAKNRIAESAEGMWQSMAPGIMRGVEPLATGVEKFIEPYFKITGKVYHHLGDLFAGVGPVIQKHFGFILGYYEDTMGKINPKAMATEYAKDIALAFGNIVDFSVGFGGGFIKAIAIIYWGVNKLEWALLQVAKAAEVADRISGRSDFTGSADAIRKHRARNQKNIDDLNRIAGKAWDWKDGQLGADLVDAIDRTNIALENAEPATDDFQKRIDWTAKVMKKFNEESKAMRDSIDPLQASSGNQVADKIEALASKYNKLKNEVSETIGELRVLGAQHELNQLSNSLDDQFENIGKSAIDQKLDKINKAFGKGAEMLGLYSEELQTFSKRMESVQRGFNLGNVESPIDKMANDYRGLVDAFNAGKINEQQLALAANNLLPSATSAQNNRATAALYGSKEVADSSFNQRFKALEKPAGPMERVADEINRQRELHRQNVQNGKAILDQLKKMETAGQI